jgi:hypothetical protein
MILNQGRLVLKHGRLILSQGCLSLKQSGHCLFQPAIALKDCHRPSPHLFSRLVDLAFGRCAAATIPWRARVAFAFVAGPRSRSRKSLPIFADRYHFTTTGPFVGECANSYLHRAWWTVILTGCSRAHVSAPEGEEKPAARNCCRGFQNTLPNWFLTIAWGFENP